MIKVSIIVPIYNSEKYLNKCLKSLINQTLKDIEIILINDGSTDNSEKIIKSFNDKRIIYVSKKNEGIGKTRNKGISIAKGKYLAFIDSDDAVSLDFCEKMYEKASKDKCDLVVCNYYNNCNNNYSKVNLENFDDTSLKANPILLNKINLGPCNKIYRTSLIIDNNIKFMENLKYEDVPFVCEALLKANKIGKINDSLCYFTVHAGSQTTIRDEKLFDILKIVDHLKKTFSSSIFKKQYNILVVKMILDYTVQTRYLKNRKLKNKFIDEAYCFLEKYIPDYKNYIANDSNLKVFFLKHKNLVKIYCNLYR